jgi:hypothetical protein
MTKNEKVQFLQEKFRLILKNLRNPEKRPLIEGMYGAIYGLTEKATANMIRSDDKSLDELLDVFPEAVQESIDAELVAKFGVARLAKQRPAATEKIVERVLKRGAIRTDEEHRTISDVVAAVDNESILGAEIYRQLAKILGRTG